MTLEEFRRAIEGAGSIRALARLTRMKPGTLATYAAGRRAIPANMAARLKLALGSSEAVPGATVTLNLATGPVSLVVCFDRMIRLEAPELAKVLGVPVEKVEPLARKAARVGTLLGWLEASLIANRLGRAAAAFPLVERMSKPVDVMMLGFALAGCPGPPSSRTPTKGMKRDRARMARKP